MGWRSRSYLAKHDMNAPIYVSIGGIFIDDIVYPDGRTSMEILGGGGVHTAAGMLVWDERPGLVATMGRGIPAAALARLEREFDMQGVVALELPQVRAWQLFEWDGRRTEIFRVEVVDPFMDDPRPEALPDSYRGAKAAAVLRDADDFLRWREVYPDAILAWEPEQAYMVASNSARIRPALRYADIVSPNLLEASLVYGLNDPDALADAMLNDGAQIVALRMGERGSLVASASERIIIPAVPVPEVIDQTGAGNTYTGAFLVGWLRTRDLRTAGYYGAVAASFALETVGVLNVPAAAERDARLRWLYEYADR